MPHTNYGRRSVDASHISRQLYITLYDVHHYQLMHKNDVNYMQRGKMFSSFCQIIKGTVRFDTQEGPIFCQPGDFVYMPDDERYASHWVGDPKIEFISVFFRFSSGSLPNMVDNEPVSRLPLDKQFAFQKIESMGGFSQLEEMTAVLREWPSGRPEDRLMSSARMYKMLALAYPHLKKRQGSGCPPSILPAVEYISQHREGNEKVSFYASLCHLSESRFYNLFSQHMKYTPIEYRNLLRAYEAGSLLRDTGLSVEEISARLGFESPEYFRRVFKKHYHSSPSAFRKTWMETPPE